MTIADTTWRMFLPSLGFTFLGIWADTKLQTSPWLMFTGILLGLSIGAFAVKLQFNKISKS